MSQVKAPVVHTALPWVVFGGDILGDVDLRNCNRGRVIVSEHFPLMPEDAAFIVRAVNAHASLVEALQNLLHSVSSGKPDVIGRGNGIVSLEMVEQARAALMKAQP